MALAGGGLAFLPVSFFVSSSLTLEPYCILFVLAGAVILLDRDEISQSMSTRRIVAGGLLLGFALLVKLWAIFPLVALALCPCPTASTSRGALPRCGSELFHDWFAALFHCRTAQFRVRGDRRTTLSAGGTDSERRDRVSILVMTGFGPTTIAPSPVVAEVVFAVLAALVAVSFTRRATLGILDMFFLLATVLIGGALLYSAESFLTTAIFSRHSCSAWCVSRPCDF